MTYCVTFFRGGEVIASDYFDEHPDEEVLRNTSAEIGADFYDICRLEDTQ